MAVSREELAWLASPVFLGGVVLGCVLLMYLVERWMLQVPYPKGIALVREPEGATSFSLRTRLAFYNDCDNCFREAYHKYLKQGKPVVIPSLGLRKEVLMPSSQMRWILAQPEEVLSVGEAFADLDQARWSLGHEKFVVDAWQGMIVKTDMNKVLETICAGLNDELGVAFDANLGTDTENWKELDLAPTVLKVVSQAASRFIVGLPLCRNQEYLATTAGLNNRLIFNAGLLGGMPVILRPLVGSLFNIPTAAALNKVKKFFEPLYRERLETLKHSPDDPNYKEPGDQLQMMMRFAARERQDKVGNIDDMTRRLQANNFGAMHQTGIQVTNLLLNVLGSDAEFNTISVLRDEIERVLGSDDSPFWTKAKVNAMTRADSVARETLRLYAFGGRANFRKVLVDDFKTPEGIHIPKGTLISFLGRPVVWEGMLEDPDRYEPFRFSRLREDAAAKDEKAPAVSMVSTSPEFLPFGHGKHACPGRFLIDFEMKMILAYLLRNYDMKFPDSYNGQRPKNYWLTEAIFPPDGVKILVKRRKVEQKQ